MFLKLPPIEGKKNRQVKINIDEEDFFEMLNKVNPKIIVKYLDMRFINHREAPIITIFECEKQKLSDRNNKKIGIVAIIKTKYQEKKHIELTEEDAIAFLKEKGYKIMKPIVEYTEI